MSSFFNIFLLCTNYSVIPVNLCKNNKYVIKFTTDEMISNFELFTKNKMDTLYLTENKIT